VKLAALTVAAAALRFSTLGLQSLWLDEATTARLMRMSFGGMLRAVPDSESTPPLYYVLSWLWTRPFGTGEVALRSLSALLGTLTVPIVYAAAQQLLRDRRAALAAAALAAFNPLLIWYSQEARSYALLVLLCALTLLALPAAERGRLWPWALACALAVATHYFAAFVVVPQALWLLRRHGRQAVPALAAVGAVMLALLPLALHQRARGSAHFIADEALGTRMLQLPKQLALGYAAPGQTLLVIAGALLAGGALWLALRREAARPLAALAALAVGVSLLLALAGVDYLLTRNLIVVWVPLALVLACAASAGRAGAGLLAGLCALGLAAVIGIDLNSRYQRDDWRDAAHAARAGSAVVVAPASGSVPLGYYLRRAGPLPPSGEPVGAVEVIALGRRDIGTGASAPRLPEPAPALAGFAPALRERHKTFSVLRLRVTGTPVVVTPALLAPLAWTDRSPAVLVDR
jgi:4-amino-4-deoxy-L-arabinose transferase-like glycosyltransferase